RREDAPEQVHVQAAAQATVRRDEDVADALDLRALLQERMLVVWIGLCEVADHRADLLGVRARRGHALLRLAHLARGHHLHGLGDLLSVLHTLDLGTDFLGAWHVMNSPFGASSHKRFPGTP